MANAKANDDAKPHSPSPTQSPQTAPGWHTRRPSEVRCAQQLLAQSLSLAQSALHTAGAPAQIVATPAGSAQQSLSVVHEVPTSRKQLAVERHQAATSQTCAPLVSVAQQPLAQSALVVQFVLQTVPPWVCRSLRRSPGRARCGDRWCHTPRAKKERPPRERGR